MAHEKGSLPEQALKNQVGATCGKWGRSAFLIADAQVVKKHGYGKAEGL